MAEELYTIKNVADMLGVTYNWVHTHLKNGAPPPEFIAVTSSGRTPTLMWTKNGVTRWLVYHASAESLPKLDRYTGYSDHKAVNILWGSPVSWKLWFRNGYDGVEWWLSSPQGWWSSSDDGRSWKFTGLMVRPTEFKYHCVNGNAKPGAAMSAVLRSCVQVRRRLEAGGDNVVDIRPKCF